MSHDLFEFHPDEHNGYIKVEGPLGGGSPRRTSDIRIGNTALCEVKTNIALFFTTSDGGRYRYDYVSRLDRMFNYSSYVADFFDIMMVKAFVAYELSGRPIRSKEFTASAGNYLKKLDFVFYVSGGVERVDCFVTEDRVAALATS